MRKMMALAVVAIAALGLGSLGIIAVTTMDAAPGSTTALPQGARPAVESITPPPVRTIATLRPVESRRAVPAAPVVAIEARTPSLLIVPPSAPAGRAVDEQDVQNAAYGNHGRGGGGRR